MKKMTCRQLGGGCDKVFVADTFDDMANLSKKHGMEMIQKGDPDHLEAMNKMQTLMQSSDAMQEWMQEKKAEFDQLEDLHD